MYRIKLTLFFLAAANLITTKTEAQTLGGLDFNGINAYVEIANDPLNTIDTGDFTIEAWIKGLEDEQNTHPMIFSNREENSLDKGIAIFFHSRWSSSQYKMLCFQINASNYLLINNGSFNGSILDGECHHIAISKSMDTITFYVDGNVIGHREIPAALSVSSSEQLFIGKDKSTNNTFNGMISQCRIWNVSRTQSDIAENMNVRLQGNEKGLVAYWEMNDEGDQIVTDKTTHFDGILGSSVEMEGVDPLWTKEGCIDETIVSTVENIEEFFFQVSPNPTSGLITIEHQNLKQTVLKIFDANGKLILSRNNDQSVSNIDMSNYDSGTYILQLVSEGQITSRKIIKL